MTDEQFEKFMAIQVAQLAMIQGIYRNSQAAVMGNKKIASHNWTDLQKDIQAAMATLKTL